MWWLPCAFLQYVTGSAHKYMPPSSPPLPFTHTHTHGRVWDDGSTAITCLVRGNRVMIANVGDSRAVASISGRAIALSVDHKPNLPAERARIQNAGGTVTSMMGCHRVMGMLAMSRALGDVMIERYLSVVSVRVREGGG